MLNVLFIPKSGQSKLVTLMQISRMYCQRNLSVFARLLALEMKLNKLHFPKLNHVLEKKLPVCGENTLPKLG
jgi:hypothetical protein